MHGRVLAEKSRPVPGTGGYVLAAEIAGLALAAELIDRVAFRDLPVTIEIDNPIVLRLLQRDYRPPGFHRIPPKLLEKAEALCWRPDLRLKVLGRNSTAGLRRAHRLASRRLWAKQHHARPQHRLSPSGAIR
jgi:hypothetical protein